MTDTDRNAVLLGAARALTKRIDQFVPSRLGHVEWAQVHDAIYDALASSSASGASAMREAAAKVAHVEDGLVPKGRAFQGNADYGPRVAERIEALIRALPLPDPVPAWRPIETAPKDGALLLATTPGGLVHMAKWTPRFAPVYGDTSAGWYSLLLDRRFDPTHWQPLPGAPA